LLDQAIEAGVKTFILRRRSFTAAGYSGFGQLRGRPGIITTVNTNGSLINEELAEKIVLSKLRNLTFSIDSAAPSS
jgi:hypothetical protein